MYQILYDLNKDTACLRDYTAIAYNIITEAFGAAETAFLSAGTTPRIDSYSPRTPSVLSVHSRRHSSGIMVHNQRHNTSELV